MGAVWCAAAAERCGAEDAKGYDGLFVGCEDRYRVCVCGSYGEREETESGAVGLERWVSERGLELDETTYGRKGRMEEGGVLGLFKHGCLWDLGERWDEHHQRREDGGNYYYWE